MGKMYSRLLCLFKLVCGSNAHCCFIGTKAIERRIEEIAAQTERDCNLELQIQEARLKVQGKTLLAETYRTQAEYLQFLDEKSATLSHVKAKENTTRKQILHLAKTVTTLESTTQTEFRESKSKLILKCEKIIQVLQQEKSHLLLEFERFKSLFNAVLESAFIRADPLDNKSFRYTPCILGSLRSRYRPLSYYVKNTGFYHMTYPVFGYHPQAENKSSESSPFDDPAFFDLVTVLLLGTQAMQTADTPRPDKHAHHEHTCQPNCIAKRQFGFSDLPFETKVLIASFLFAR
jgi:hypothetical protein